MAYTISEFLRYFTRKNTNERAEGIREKVLMKIIIIIYTVQKIPNYELATTATLEL